MPGLMKLGLVGLLVSVSTSSPLAVAADTQLAKVSYAVGSVVSTDGYDGEKQISGVYDYAGGFVNRARINFQGSSILRGFSIRIPAFCTGVEVLEAGVVTGNGDIEAAATDASRSHFATSGLNVVSGVWVTLNGPATAVCSIPILQDGDSIQAAPSLVDGQFLGPDGTNMQIQNGLVMSHNMTLRSAAVRYQAPLIFTTGFSPVRGNDMTFYASATADLYATNALGQAVICRYPVGVSMTAVVSDFSQFTLTLIFADQVGIDAFGRCIGVGTRRSTVFLRKH